MICNPPPKRPTSRISDWAARKQRAEGGKPLAHAASYQAPLLNVRGAAAHLHVSEKTIRRLIKSGALNAVRINRLVRIPRSDLERFLASASTNPVSSTRPEEDSHG